MSEPDRPHPQNIAGPFYVVDGCCTACGVPFTEAPGLFAYDDDCHCFVQRQPSTQEEINQMMRAAWAAELQCIRYRGEDAKVIRRFAELGEPDLCDVALPETIQPVFRNHVTFDAANSQMDSITPRDLALTFQAYLASEHAWLSYEFTPIAVKDEAVAFSFSWYQGNFHPIEILAVALPHCRWLVRLSHIEKAGSRSVSNAVDDWLKRDARFCNIRWYGEEQWNSSKDYQETPW